MSNRANITLIFVLVALTLSASAALVYTAYSMYNPSPEPEETEHSVTLYTSVDDTFAAMVAKRYTEKTGVIVNIVGDTEATKTTGLVARLKAEADHPIADLWWSSEPFGTIDLAQRGILMDGALDGLASEGWPEGLSSEDGTWIGFASRARVIVYAPDRVESPPTTLRDFAQPVWKGRIGMARPQFGTTRGHMGILVDRWGLPEFERWLTMLKNNNIRIYDGNASVVRAIAMGEIDLGLTDTDDVWSGQSNGWKVDCVYESFDSPMTMTTLHSHGPTLLPNTIGIVRGTTNIVNATTLAEFLLSPEVEQLLADSDSRNLPANPALAELFDSIAPESLSGTDPNRLKDQSIYPDYPSAATRIDDAMDACDRILGL